MSDITTDDIDVAISGIFAEFIEQNFDTRQRAVQAGAEVLKARLEQATPVNTGVTAKSWVIKDKYPDHRYVGNTNTAKGEITEKSGKKKRKRSNVPITTLLEYGSKSPHKGFIRKTYDQCEQEIYAAMVKEFNK